MKRTRLMVAGIFALAAACSSDSTTGTTGTTAAEDAVITQDAATMAADGVAEDIDVMAGMDGDIGNITISADLSNSNSGAFFSPPGHRPGITGCSFAGGSFTCPAENHNGLTVTRTITFMDASGATQTDYDSLLTASVHIVADISGSVTRGPWTATVTRHRDFTITGLAGQETTRTVNGTGSETVSNSRVTQNGATRSYNTVGASTLTNVVLPVKSDGTDPWPLSGTVTRTFTITLTSGPHSGDTKTRTVTITFDGTATPGGTVNGTPFTIDLGHRSAAKRG